MAVSTTRGGQLEEALVEACPRARSGSRRGRRPPRARRPGRASRRSRRAPRRSGGAAPPAPARHRPRAASRRTRLRVRDLDLAAREAVPVGRCRTRGRRPRPDRLLVELRAEPADRAARSAGRPSPRPSTCRSARPATISASRSGSASSIGRPGTVDPEEAVAHLEIVHGDALLAREALAAAFSRSVLGRAPAPTRPARARAALVDEEREPPRTDEDACRLPPKRRQPSARAAAPRASRHAEAGSSSQPISSSRLGKGLHVELGDARARGCEPGRCTRPARSRRSRRARPAG